MMTAEISFQSGEVSLAGTLTTPDMDDPYPAVVVAHTSAAGTRDFGVYQHVANVLFACGVAVLRFDRRGSGASTGNFERATFFDLAADMQAAINALKLRGDIDPEYIGVWGMSQGGWIAPLTASRSADVAFVVAVSAVGVSPAEQMNYSAAYGLREHGFPERTVGHMLALRGLVDRYYRGQTSRSEVQAEIDMARDEAWFPLAYLNDSVPDDPTTTKWYQEMDYDPIPAIQQLDVPVLLLYGEHDPWVPIAESIAVWKEHGPGDLTVHQIDDANHFMISIADAGIQGDEGGPVEEYSAIFAQWVQAQVAGKASA